MPICLQTVNLQFIWQITQLQLKSLNKSHIIINGLNKEQWNS